MWLLDTFNPNVELEDFCFLEPWILVFWKSNLGLVCILQNAIQIFSKHSQTVKCWTKYYFKSLVTSNRNLNLEINQRIKSVGNAVFKLKHRVLDCKDLRNETKVAVCKALVLPILLYKSKCWTVYKKHVGALKKFQEDSYEISSKLSKRILICTFTIC